uniref:Secreted protein n=1 Tax=Anopheles dirus TaxID=7168 RepID=A0A182NWX6_9DIPT
FNRCSGSSVLSCSVVLALLRESASVLTRPASHIWSHVVTVAAWAGCNDDPCFATRSPATAASEQATVPVNYVRVSVCPSGVSRSLPCRVRLLRGRGGGALGFPPSRIGSPPGAGSDRLELSNRASPVRSRASC